jgi:hypothetical protein
MTTTATTTHKPAPTTTARPKAKPPATGGTLADCTRHLDYLIGWCDQLQRALDALARYAGPPYGDPAAVDAEAQAALSTANVNALAADLDKAAALVEGQLNTLEPIWYRLYPDHAPRPQNAEDTRPPRP